MQLFLYLARSPSHGVEAVYVSAFGDAWAAASDCLFMSISFWPNPDQIINVLHENGRS
jgi:hypothetical protein